MLRVILPRLIVLIACSVTVACTVNITSGGLTPSPPQATPTPAGNTTSGGLTPSPPQATPTPTVGTITGQVTFSPGHPVAGVQVQLTDLPAFTATSDSDGRYTLREVPPGQHGIQAQSSSWGSGEQTVFVRANETTDQDL